MEEEQEVEEQEESSREDEEEEEMVRDMVLVFFCTLWMLRSHISAQLGQNFSAYICLFSFLLYSNSLICNLGILLFYSSLQKTTEILCTAVR